VDEFAEDKSSYLINNYQSAAGKSFLLHQDPGGYIKGHLDDGTTALSLEWAGVVLNQWYHIVLVRDYGVKAYLYINGEQKDEVNDTAGDIGSDKNVVIGASSTTLTSQNFNGSIDEVRIYNRAVPQTEIIKHYDLLPPQ